MTGQVLVKAGSYLGPRNNRMGRGAEILSQGSDTRYWAIEAGETKEKGREKPMGRKVTVGAEMGREHNLALVFSPWPCRLWSEESQSLPSSTN